MVYLFRIIRGGGGGEAIDILLLSPLVSFLPIIQFVFVAVVCFYSCFVRVDGIPV